MKKLNLKKRRALAAVCALLAMSSFSIGHASEAITASGGTEDSLNEVTNAKDNTVEGFEAYEGSTAGILNFFGMGSIQNAAGSATNSSADYVYFTNDGVINLNYADLLAQYSGYTNYMGRGIIVGGNSIVVNNGRILFNYNEASDVTSDLYFHGILAGTNSTVTNNGSIEITGAGSSGANVRGITTNNTHMTMTNNGTIDINVDDAAMSRALATTGEGSTLTNNGTINNTTNGINYGASVTNAGRIVNNGTMSVTANADGTTKASPIYAPVAIGMAQAGGNLYRDGTTFEDSGLVNNGVLNVSVIGDSDLTATTPAVGVMILNHSYNFDTGTWNISNTGIINRSTTAVASEANNYIVRTPEIGVNLVYVNEVAAANAKIGTWATELRDFGTTKDFIQVQPRSNVSTGEVLIPTLDFSSTNMVLRPAEGYNAGTTYTISKDTLITPIDGSAVDSVLNVTGMDKMTFSSEVPELYTVNVTENSSGNYSVNLTPSVSEAFMSSALMFPVDYTRASLDRLSYELETSQKKWFITPYYVRTDRSNGIDGNSHGFIGGSNWNFGEKISGGIHLSYSLGNGDNANAYSHLKTFMGGIHLNYYPEEDKNWIRGQFTFGRNEGDTDLNILTSTGNNLNGKHSADSDNFYAELNLGQKNNLSESNDLITEFGLSYLQMNNNDPIKWNYLGEEMSAYQMNTDNYNALYATAKAALLHRFSEDGGALRFSLGLRGRLSSDEMKINFMGSDSAKIKEDPVQGLVDLSYAHSLSRVSKLNIGYQGIFGKDSKSHGVYASYKLSF